MKSIGIIKIIIIEEERVHVQSLEHALRKSNYDISIVASFTNTRLLSDFLNKTTEPDLIIFGRNEESEILYKTVMAFRLTCPVIYTYHVDEKIDLHPELNVIGFIVKPLNDEDILKEIKKYIKIKEYFFNQFGSLLISYQNNTPGRRARFIVRKGQENSVIKTDEIAYFYNENRLTYIVDNKGNKYFLDEPLVKIQGLLDPSLFFRVSRKYLVNINSIKRFRTLDKSKIQLVIDPEPSEAVMISSSGAADFRKWISEEFM